MRFRPALDFIVGVKKSVVFLDGPANRAAELILAKNVGTFCLKKIDSVQFVVAEILVERSVPFIGAAARDDVDDARSSAAEFRRIVGIDDAKFLNRLLRWRPALDAGRGRDIVGAVYGDEVIVNVLACEGELGHRLDDHIGTAGCGVSDGHGRGEQSEVNKLAAVHRKIDDLALGNHRTDLRARRLCQFGGGLHFDFLRHLTWQQ